MKDFLRMDVCIEDARLVQDEPFSMEEYAALAQLLEKFSGKCGSIGDILKVLAVRSMVTEAAVREVKKDV